MGLRDKQVNIMHHRCIPKDWKNVILGPEVRFESNGFDVAGGISMFHENFRERAHLS